MTIVSDIWVKVKGLEPCSPLDLLDMFRSVLSATTDPQELLLLLMLLVLLLLMLLLMLLGVTYART